MIELTIESITKPLKQKRLSRVSGKLKGLDITVDLNSLTVNYDSQEINLASIPGTYGGVRYFFLCPDCGRRCRKLYKQYLYFGCGMCQQVYKKTLNRSKTDCQYYFELAFKEARKIDPSYYPQKGVKDKHLVEVSGLKDYREVSSIRQKAIKNLEKLQKQLEQPQA
ncbi:TPA: hypothetical protein U1136_001492 [Streptococcus suis]|nr:hypothetical protein [Streptococcus suis]HEM4899364.1 hypothetical protein [Streptococcus suis]